MKEFGSEKIFFDKTTAVRTLWYLDKEINLISDCVMQVAIQIWQLYSVPNDFFSYILLQVSTQA